MSDENKEYLKRIGRKIAEARKSKNFTQDELGDLIQMEKSNLSAIENGKQNVTALTLKRIADALEADVTSFFS